MKPNKRPNLLPINFNPSKNSIVPIDPKPSQTTKKLARHKNQPIWQKRVALMTTR